MPYSNVNLDHSGYIDQVNLPKLEAIALCKRFGKFVALDRVSFTLEPGSFHALLGENGAGKSTLVKCLIGFYAPDAGQILIDGRSPTINNPRAAQKLGIGMVYQNFTSIPAMTIAENLVLSELGGNLIINWQQERQKLQTFMQQAPFPMPLDLVVGQISAGQKQKLEILKQLYLNNRILILDEPTTVLLPQEADEMLSMLQQMVKKQQLSVLLITHKFREVINYCDRVTVLRRGKLAGAGMVKDFRIEDLAALMVGEKTTLQRAIIAEQEHLEPVTSSVIDRNTNNTNQNSAGDRFSVNHHNNSTPAPSDQTKSGIALPETNSANGDRSGLSIADHANSQSLDRPTQPVLQLKNISARSDRDTIAVKQISLAVYGGEIVGIAGVAGNGQKELVEVLFGQRQATGGQVLVNGEVYQARRSQIQKHQIFALPEEPLRNGCVATMSVAENLALRGFDRPPLSKHGLVIYNAIRQLAQKLVSAFAIKTASIDQAIANLSGGNIQRTVLARELSSEQIKLLIAVNPCAGLDFTAVEYILQKLREARDRGIAILLVSDDLDELLTIGDRLLVISEGSLVYECAARDADLQKIASHMAGITDV
jgi:ABC-type uncharacterized transport system ATPase subunit